MLEAVEFSGVDCRDLAVGGGDEGWGWEVSGRETRSRF
jgi:hypothetical protein